MKRALVLGGGGVVGVAWESGLAAGMAEGGVPLDDIDLVVGTSAGAIVGSQLLTGKLRTLEDRDGKAASPVDFSKIDPEAMGKIFTMWSKLERTTPPDAAAIGALARIQNRDGEPAFVEAFAAGIGVHEWPATPVWICAVNTESGERRVFDRDSGVPIGRALAASASVPGLFPSVEIDGALYMDGQVHSSTNADVLLDVRPAQVLIAMPTNEHNARSIGSHARRAAEAEISALEAAGCTVHFCTPSEEDAGKMGSNLMDPAGVPAAYAAGLSAGKAWAAALG